ncbi:MAG: hypothetical protein HKM24_06355, partial [Gammaproteobacteria bacterium]|nr:hypothetical protein [Gammaproteobacteria bacterium]
DNIDEPNETAVIDLGTPTNAGVGMLTSHTFTINDDDNFPVASFNRTEPKYKPEGKPTIQNKVVLSNPSSEDLNVYYSIGIPGRAPAYPATEGVDFTDVTHGMITIPAGADFGYIVIAGIEDALDEFDEVVSLNLIENRNAQYRLPPTTHLDIFLEDNDNSPTVAFTKDAKTKPESQADIDSKLVLSEVSGRDIYVDYFFDTKGGTASLGDDFTDDTNPTRAYASVYIPEGQTFGFVELAINDDALDENNETIIIQIADLNPEFNYVDNGTTNQSMTVTLTDNDEAPSVQFDNATASLSEDACAQCRGQGETFSYAVSLDAASGLDVTVPYAVSGTASDSGVDFTDTTMESVTIEAGQTTVDVQFTIFNDALDEDDETIVATIGTPTNASVGTNGALTVTITDDDSEPFVAFNNISKTKSESQARVINLVSLSAVSGRDVEVPYSFGLTRTINEAILGDDFTDFTDGSITIPAGDSGAYIDLRMIDDALDEYDENIYVTLGRPVNA